MPVKKVAENSDTLTSDAWYLVANKNNLTIKVLNSITLGENESGMLVLDSRVDAQRWVTLAVDPAGCLNVTYQHAGCRLTCPDQWVADSAGAVLARWTMLELPNNQIYVSQQLQRGAVEQRVLVEYSARPNPIAAAAANDQIIVDENAQELSSDYEEVHHKKIVGELEEISALAENLVADIQPVIESLEVEAEAAVNDAIVEDVVVAEAFAVENALEVQAEIERPIDAEQATPAVESDAQEGIPPVLKEVVKPPEVLDAMLRRLEQQEIAQRVNAPVLEDIEPVFAVQENPSTSKQPRQDELLVKPAVESVYKPLRRRKSKPLLVASVVVILIAVFGFAVGSQEADTSKVDSPFLSGK